MQEYWYIEKNNETNQVVAFEGREELQKRIDASNQRREEGQRESQFYGYFSKAAAQEYKSRITTACTTDSPVGFNSHGPSCACDDCKYKPDLPNPASR